MKIVYEPPNCNFVLSVSESMLNFMFVDCIRNGEHIEEQVDQPTLPGPMDAPEDASKESVSSTKESDEVEETMGT